MSACFCMGPQGADPVCPCQMRARGQVPSAPDYREWMFKPIQAEKVEPLWPNQTRPAIYMTEEDVRRIIREELARSRT